MGQELSGTERVLFALFRPLAVLAAAYGFTPPPYALAHLLGRQAAPSEEAARTAGYDDGWPGGGPDGVRRR
ncbi:hypothetical protein GCM10009760_45170 [Kitasatospora kazusensis]|uniref:Uncharacterized protein n=1 Tax=Kitasatospora kazusensis TaxID=407974 RepID=A0ABN2ZZF1_9ACTN